MELKNIEAFLMIAEKESFSEAAEELNITQPTISVRIKQLENEYNTPLFTRESGKKIKLTDRGQEVYSYFKEAHALIKKAERLLMQGESTELKKVTISSPNHMGVNIMPELLQVLYKAFPTIDFELQVQETKDTIKLIRQGKVLFGLGYIFPNMEIDDLEIVKIKNEKNLLLCSPTHPFAKKPTIAFEELKKERIIIYSRRFPATQSIEQFLKSKGIDITNNLEVSNLGWIKGMVQKGVGVTILQKMIVENELENGRLVALHLPSSLPENPVYVIFDVNTPKQLRETVTNALKNIVQ